MVTFRLIVPRVATVLVMGSQGLAQGTLAAQLAELVTLKGKVASGRHAFASMRFIVCGPSRWRPRIPR